MDPGAVDASKVQPQQVLTAEAIQAAFAALLPGAPAGAAQVQQVPAQHAALPQALQVQHEQPSSTKQPAKRKGTRTCVEAAVCTTGPPRPPPIKHEVYEDLEEKFNQLQAEREPKRHRGNPKGYQIKSFCKNPACGKQLNGGRTNRCEHCGFDLASHRRNSQMERLIKSGPLTHAQVRTALRDAANEVHVRTGGKAVVLTLVYIEGGGPAPAQAIAYGKPAAGFVESRKELVTNFEAACREHFKEPPGALQQQQQQLHPNTAALGSAPQLGALATLTGAGAQFPGYAAAAGSAEASNTSAGGSAGRPCSLGPTSQFLCAIGAAAAAAAAAAGLAPTALPLAAAAAAATTPVDLESVIESTLADPRVAIARCREARVSGEVLARLPQSMQLTVLMQAGLLAGEAASVVVELESRQRLQQMPVLSLAALNQHLPMPPPPPPQQQQQQHAAATTTALLPAQPPPVQAAVLLQGAPPQLLTAAVPQQQAMAPVPPPLLPPAAAEPVWGPGVGGCGGVSAAAFLSCTPGSGAAINSAPGPQNPSYQHPSVGGGMAPGGAAPAAALHGGGGGGVALVGPLQAALMAAAVVGAEGESAGEHGATAQAAGTSAAGGTQQHNLQQLFQGLLPVARQAGPMPGAPGQVPELGHQAMSAMVGQLAGPGHAEQHL